MLPHSNLRTVLVRGKLLPAYQLDLDQLDLGALPPWLKFAWSFLKSEFLLSKLSMVAELVLSSFDVHLGSFFRKQPRIIQFVHKLGPDNSH